VVEDFADYVAAQGVALQLVEADPGSAKGLLIGNLLGRCLVGRMAKQEDSQAQAAVGLWRIFDAEEASDLDRNARLFEGFAPGSAYRIFAGLDATGRQIPGLIVVALVDEKKAVASSDDKEHVYCCRDWRTSHLGYLH
jgi:hypothetical protein